jgi:hypothetical protein
MLCLRTDLSFKKKQQTEYALAVAPLSCALNETLERRLLFDKRSFHSLFCPTPIKSILSLLLQSGNDLNGA